MGLIDSIKSAVVRTKLPSFTITNFNRNNLFEGLGKDLNYLDQAVLYTYKGIDMISDAVASADLRLIHKMGDDKVEVDDIDLLEDLYHFNDYMSLYEARKLKEEHLRYTGRAFWYIERNDISKKARKAEFFPLDPMRMEVKTNSAGLIEAFQYEDGDGREVMLPYEDVVYFRRPSIKNWIEGFSQVEAMQFIHNAYSYAMQHNMNVFANGARPDFLLEVEGISEEQRQRLEEQFSEKYQGVKNARKKGIINTGIKVHELSKSNKDLDYVEGAKMLRQDILALLGIPEALLFPSATNSNSKQARIVFQRDTVLPALKMEQSTLNEQLIDKYGVNENRGYYYFEFNGVVDVDLESTATAVEKLKDYLTVNEVREMLGMPPFDDERSNEIPTAQKSEVINEVRSIKKEIKEKSLNKIEEDEDGKALEEAIGVERQFRGITDGFFIDQGIRTANKFKDRTPKLKDAFNLVDETEIAEQVYKPLYDSIADQINTSVNVEVRQKLLKKNNKAFLTYKPKALSEGAISLINERLKYFSSEFSKTTQDQLFKIISEGIKNDKTSRQIAFDISRLFSSFVDGKGNIDVLEKYGVYLPPIEQRADGSHVPVSSKRYAEMLTEVTSNLEGDERREALTALNGMVADEQDEEASSVRQILKRVYRISDYNSIVDFRSQMIARTEGNTVKEMIRREEYENNEFIIGARWKSANQPGVTRDAHLQASGQVVPKGQPFIVGGEKLLYPGDSSLGASADNTINCRCRITAVVEDGLQ